MVKIPDHVLHRVCFFVPAPKLKAAIARKVAELKAKRHTREARIKRIRSENGITDAVLADLYRQMESDRQHTLITYTVASVAVGSKVRGDAGSKGKVEELVIPAGIVAQLQAEEHALDTEGRSIDRLERIARNMDPKGKHEVEYDDLEALGF